MRLLALLPILALVSAHTPLDPRAPHHPHSVSLDASASASAPAVSHGLPHALGSFASRPTGGVKPRSIRKRKVRRRRRRSCNGQLIKSVSATTAAAAVTTLSTTPVATTKSSTTTMAYSSITTTATTTSTTSSSTPSSTSTAAATTTSSSSTTNSLLSELFPLGLGSSYWTTCPSSSSALSFTSALTPLQYGSLPSQGSAPDGSTSLVAFYPKGSVDLSTGAGFSFYTAGAHNGVDVTSATEVVFSYSVYFQSGFQFNLGGKLPGLYGGTSLDNAKSCSGGRQDLRDTCFSARMMFRANGMGELYNYYPTSVTQPNNYCSTPPLSICNPDYGDSIGRGSFTFPTGQWVTVAQHLKLNDVGKANGVQELYVNGQKVISLNTLEIRTQAATKIYGIMAQTFFGGNAASWSSPQDQSAWFKDWSLAILA